MIEALASGAVDIADADVCFEPPGDGEGHWVGAPCVHRHDGRSYLAVRWRDPERRGYAVVVYERTGASSFEPLVRITADELGVESVERPALATDPRDGRLRCYLPVDHGANDWTIQALAPVSSPAELDPASARDVLVPGRDTDARTVKDPCVAVCGGRFLMFYAGHDGVSERAHLATSGDGWRWRRVPDNPVLGRAGWHDHHVRVTCAVPAPAAPGWLLCYGGSGTDDHGATWNLRTGVAVATDPSAPLDCTPDEPALAAPHVDGGPALDRFGTCRYVDVCVHDGRRELFAEVARPDGAFDLRRVDLGPVG